MSSTETRSLFELLDAVVDALRPLQDEIPGLQLTGDLNGSPNPPSVDVYPASPFMQPGSFDVAGDQIFLTVRARVNTADQKAGQRQLLRMLDPTNDASIAALLYESPVTVLEVSEYREYPSDSGKSQLGAEWRVTAFL